MDLRRAGEAHRGASGFSQLRQDARSPVRRTARGPCEREQHHRHRHRMGQRFHPSILPRSNHIGRADGRARRDCRLGASHLRLARPLARLQGGLSGDVGSQRRVLCTVRRECASLVPIRAGARAVRQSRHHPSAARSTSAAGRLRQRRRCVRSRHQGNRCGHSRLRGQGCREQDRR